MDTATDADVGSLIMLQQMPLFYSALVVENTSRCNARCAMCYQGAGPKGSDLWGAAALKPSEVKRVIREAIAIETLFPRFHLSGGEAFLRIEDCLEIFREARDSGFVDITTTTNAYWAANRVKAHAVCEELRKCGVTSMEISWDIWHLPYVRPEAISNCLDICEQYEIETNLRILSTKSHPYSEALALLNPAAIDKACRVTAGPVFATGRAKTTIPVDDFHRQSDLDSNCHSVLNLTVNALGNVYPCCAGLDQTDTYLFGNVRRQSIASIAESMNRSALLRTIVFSGIAALIPILERAGIAVGRDFNGICHLCWSIFSNPEWVKAIEQHFDRAALRALQRIVSGIERSAEATHS